MEKPYNPKTHKGLFTVVSVSTVLLLFVVLIFSGSPHFLTEASSSGPGTSFQGVSSGNAGSRQALLSGQVAFTIPIDSASLTYGIQPGDYVDVLVSFLFVAVDSTFQTRLPNKISLITRLETGELSVGEGYQGRAEASPLTPEGVLIGPGEAVQRPSRVAQCAVQEALIIHIEDGTGTDPDTRKVRVTLGVTLQDALTLFWVVEEGLPIALTLRGEEEAESVESTQSVTLDYIIHTFNVAPPSGLEWALETPESEK